MSSFPFVQVNDGVNSSSLALASPSTPGNILVAVWGGVKSGFATGTLPSTLTDNNGNTYYLASKLISNQLAVGIWVALNIAAAVPHQPVQVTFSSPTGGALVPQSPSIILAEYGPPPSKYQVFGEDCNGNVAGLVDFQFEQLGGLTTGFTGIQISRTGSGINDQTVGLLLLDQFGDALLIACDYSQWTYTGSIAWSCSPGTVRASTSEVTTGIYNDSLVLTDSDFAVASGCGTSSTTLVVNCGSPPSGTIGSPYSHTFPVSGGFPPYTYALNTGSFPPGLTLNSSTGVLSGTPTTNGTYTFTIEVTDSLGNTAVTPSCSITIGGCGPGSSGNYGWTG